MGFNLEKCVISFGGHNSSCELWRMTFIVFVGGGGEGEGVSGDMFSVWNLTPYA